MIRVFVAIPLPGAVVADLVPLCNGLPGAKWTLPEQFHLTLRFIGEVAEARFADIAEVLAEVAAPAFELTVTGVGHFTTAGRPRVLWAGVAKSQALDTLARRIDQVLREIGLRGDSRGFMPHVALARLKDSPLERVRDFLARHEGLALPPYPVTAFALFSSVLRTERAIHREEAVYPLE